MTRAVAACYTGSFMSQNTVDAVKAYRRVGEFAVREIAGETILMPVRSHGTGPDSIRILNPTASLLWKALERPATVDDLVASVLAEFEVERSDARTDVEEFLATLSSAGLVQEA